MNQSTGNRAIKLSKAARGQYLLDASLSEAFEISGGKYWVL